MVRTLWTSLLLIVLINYSINHNCVHDRISLAVGAPIILDENQDISEFPRFNERRLNDPSRPIRIKPDFTTLNSDDIIFNTYLKYAIFPRISAILQRYISVNDANTIGNFSATSCSAYFTVPVSYATNTTNADLIIFFTVSNDLEAYLAFAAPCLLRSSNKRPIVGFININKNYVKYGKNETDSFIYTMIHEIIHILALSPSLYSHFNQPGEKFIRSSITTNAGTLETYKLTTPKLVSTAKEYFGCDNIDGVLLENEGNSRSTGAHFEKLHFGNELMTAQITGYPIFSIFSLALLEDTGWYQITYKQAERLAWGNKRGCNFYNNTTCLTNKSEYCSSVGEFGCSPDYLGRTYCMTTKFSDKCIVSEFFSNYMCEDENHVFTNVSAAPGNRCFQYRINSNKYAGCLSATCIDNKIQINIGNDSYICPDSSSGVKSTIKYKQYEIECPDPIDFCTRLDNSCKNDCSLNGRCLNDKTCSCYAFYDGDDCSKPKKCTHEEASICSKINPGGELEPSQTDNSADSNNNATNDRETNNTEEEKSNKNENTNENDNANNNNNTDNKDESDAINNNSNNEDDTDFDNTQKDDENNESDTYKESDDTNNKFLPIKTILVVIILILFYII